VVNRVRQRGKSARDCAVGLLRLVGLCPGVARRRNHQNRIKQSEKIFLRWCDGAASRHVVFDWEV
jgi:hypothetical protein